MKTIKLLLLSFVLTVPSAFASGKTLTEDMKVLEMFWSFERQMYRIHFQGKSGAYFANKSNSECLSQSMRENTLVKIEYFPGNLMVKDCKRN